MKNTLKTCVAVGSVALFMHTLAVVVALLATPAHATEKVFAETDAGTAAQTWLVPPGRTITVWCTASVRYRTGNSSTLIAATTRNATVIEFPGDPYRIPIPTNEDRISLIHKDGTTAFQCYLSTVVP